MDLECRKPQEAPCALAPWVARREQGHVAGQTPALALGVAASRPLEGGVVSAVVGKSHPILSPGFLQSFP